MARCGRCGLWSKTPPDHKEQKWAGTCLWFQTRLEKEFEYEKRKCEEFFERIPPHDASWHFEYKCKRDNLGDAYTAAKKSNKKAMIAIALSVSSLGISIIKMFM